MTTELVTITIADLQVAFETAVEKLNGSYPGPAIVQSFLRMVIQRATVGGRDIVGEERSQLLRKWLR